jgi:hypothetical protein
MAKETGKDAKKSGAFTHIFSPIKIGPIELKNRIALARGYFNDIATFYNARLEVVPDRFVAALARLAPP